MILNLCAGLAERVRRLDLVLVRADSAHVTDLPASVRIVNLNARHTFTSLLPLARYLRRERPSVLLAAKDRAIRVAVVARVLARVPLRLVGRIGTTVSAALAGRGAWRLAVWRAGMRLFYPGADLIVAVSQGVADDIVHLAQLAPDRVRVVPNPVWTPRLERLAREAPAHPWFSEPSVPLVLSAGRLTRQKDFPTLIRAFAQVRAERPCRLMILGDGGQRDDLLALAKQLGVAEDVALPGFQANPYAYVAHASLFVLSSVWEGSPNVLTEALALGIPVVSTDCPSGPREILAGGRYGKLVPTGDGDALARAMLETLANPLPRDALMQAARPYSLEASTRGYLEALAIGPPPSVESTSA
ncbi:glycosyl transferase [Sulfurifustis variabilis]|uniref:Glycosyl transferase n=2 Tax=Sulfurifustis variabilis TaxID=1675686 RepID=A0A1B4VH14_9GAMM|nr:glycosyl transferase [Sulfurifustis variabilis]